MAERRRKNVVGAQDNPERASSQLSLVALLLSALVAANLLGRAACTVEQWTIGIPGGAHEADRVAAENGCKNLGLVVGLDDVYLFEKRVQGMQSVHREKRTLEAHPFVSWVDPQLPMERVKRGFVPAPPLPAGHSKQHAPLAGHAQKKPDGQSQQLPSSSTFRSHADRDGFASSAGSAAVPGSDGAERPFNDELWTHQWYLQNNSNVAQLQGEVDLNVEEVWKMGYTGAGVVVTILDDGLEHNHTDIWPNYDARASWDMNNNKPDPFPRYDAGDNNSHGTRCAGEVAMVANNRKCGVGVAPRARIGGIKCLDGEVKDHIEYYSLMHKLDYIDIYSGSWGPSDNGQVVDGPKRLASKALRMGVEQGRNGKGALYVWANGNGGHAGDNCNCDGYVNSIYTLSIGAVTQQGQLPFYGERCSSTLAVSCSSGAYTDRKIVTTDLHNKCTIDYTGTSAAAPLAAGLYALVLEANNNLTWRDVQHLTAWTSNPIPIRDNPGWKRNGAGLIFNSRFGFGLLNAKAMVDAALRWQTVPKKAVCIMSPASRLPVHLQSRNTAQLVFVSDGCQRAQQQQQLHQQFLSPALQLDQQQQRSPAHLAAPPQQQQQQQQQLRHLNASSIGGGPHDVLGPVLYLEHVQLVVDIEYTTRGSLDIYLISPAGTVSTLLSRRPQDMSRSGFTNWPLMSVHFWGESAVGKWTLIVRDKSGQNNRGWLRNATLKLHGSQQIPAHMANGLKRVYEGESEVQPFLDPVLEFDEDDIYDLNTFPNEMALVRDDSFQPTFIKSVIAMEQMSSSAHRRRYHRV